MRMIFFPLLLIFCLSSCKTSKRNEISSSDILKDFNVDDSPVFCTRSNNVEIIDLNEVFGTEDLSIDSLLDTLYFIPLQTTDESLFYGIQSVVVTDERIFLSDFDDNLFIFNSDGSFVNKLQQGQGPGEIYSLDDFSYDESTQTLVVAQVDNLNFYDKDGNYLYSKMSPFMSWSISTEKWGYVFMQGQFINNNLGDNTKYAVLITDKESKLIGKGIDLMQTKGFVRSFPYLFRNNSVVVFSLPGNDTIYNITNSFIEAKYVLNFAKYECDVSSQDDVLNSIKYYHSAGFIENSRTQIMHFSSAKSGFYTVLRDKKSKLSLGAKQFKCDADNVPLYCSDVRTVFNDFFVSFINPNHNMHFSHSAISESDNQKLANLSEDDNSVLVFFKFEEFKQ